MQHQHFFSNATQTLTVNTGDTLVAHVYLDPVNPHRFYRRPELCHELPSS